MSVFGTIKRLRFEKVAGGDAGLAGVGFDLIRQFANPIVGNMGQKTRVAFQEARLKMMNSEYKNVYETIIRQDPILRDYEDKESLKEAYKVMIRFAPSLATEKLVARGFLRMYVQGDGVIPEQQVQRLVEAENKYVGGK